MLWEGWATLAPEVGVEDDSIGTEDSLEGIETAGRTVKVAGCDSVGRLLDS